MKKATGETNGEWQKKKLIKAVEDDGTLTFFWREHTILILLGMFAMLTYVAVFEEPNEDSVYNKKRGIISCAFFFVLFGITQSPNGPFIRPHPAFWKLILVLSVLYEIFLVYLLFQVSTYFS